MRIGALSPDHQVVCDANAQLVTQSDPDRASREILRLKYRSDNCLIFSGFSTTFATETKEHPIHVCVQMPCVSGREKGSQKPHFTIAVAKQCQGAASTGRACLGKAKIRWGEEGPSRVGRRASLAWGRQVPRGPCPCMPVPTDHATVVWVDAKGQCDMQNPGESVAHEARWRATGTHAQFPGIDHLFGSFIWGASH